MSKYKEAKELFNLFMPRGVTATEDAYKHVAKYGGVEGACYDGVAIMALQNKLTSEQFVMARAAIKTHFIRKAVKDVTIK